MALPGVGPNPDQRQVAERLGVLIRDYNRADYAIPLYAADTGSATAYAIAPVPGIEFYAVGQIFTFKAGNANTGTAPTLAVNGLTAGTITMPDGSALVAGDIAANAMVAVQVASTTPTFHLLNPARADTRLLQMVVTQTGAVATGTTTLPNDDTIPQSTEGDQYMTLSITPRSASSRLEVDVCWNGSCSTVTYVTVALFRDSGADALASAFFSGNATDGQQVNFRYVMNSPGTSSTTFKVRAGPNAAATVTFNGVSAGRKYGGTMASSIVIREVIP